MNDMGDDSKLVYDEPGERLTAVAGEAVDYFPFTDGRDERIAELEEVLRLGYRAVECYILAPMHTHDDFASEQATRDCPRCLQKDELRIWLPIAEAALEGQ